MKTFNAILLVALMLAGCSSEPMPPMVYIKCDPGTNLADKIDLSIFGELKPGIRFAEATAKFDEPKRSWTGTNGTVYQLYSFPQADVAVAKETSTSGGIVEDLPTLDTPPRANTTNPERIRRGWLAVPDTRRRQQTSG